MPTSKSSTDDTTSQSADVVPAQEKPVVGYTTKMFVQSLFPYRKSEDEKRVLTQGSNSITISSTAGLPYGRFPRLIMAYLITQITERDRQVKRGTLSREEARKIPLGYSMNEFLNQIGLQARGTGGKSGSLTRLRDQLRRINRCTITVESRLPNRDVGINTQIASSWDLWFSEKHPNQGSLTPSHITVTEEYFNYVAEAPIPIDLNVMRKLRSPRAMDCYSWLVTKQYWLHKKNIDQHTFSWQTLVNNFSGTPVTTSRQLTHFRQDFQNAVSEIRKQWPKLEVEINGQDGLTVHSSKLAIPEKDEEDQNVK